MIFPLAEILKVFFALEWVFTFGISSCLQITLLVYPALARSLMGPFGLIIHGMTRKWSAKVEENVEICKYENLQMEYPILPECQIMTPLLLPAISSPARCCFVAGYRGKPGPGPAQSCGRIR